MDREPKPNQESPQQERISQAERFFAHTVLNGFPEDLAAKFAARWGAVGVEHDRIDRKQWEALASYANTPAEKIHSVTDIMQAALEKRLQSKPPKIQEAPPERQQAVIELLGLPEFSENHTPFTSLDDLYEEYKTIAKKYSPEIAKEYWLVTQSVNASLKEDVKIASRGKITEVGNPFFTRLSIYLTNRYREENLDTTMANQPEKVAETYTNLDQLFSEYERLALQTTDSNDYEVTMEWLASLHIQLPKEVRGKLASSATLTDGEFSVDKEIPTKTNDGLNKQEMKGLYRFLSRKLVQKRRAEEKKLDEQREKITPPIKKERPPNQLLAETTKIANQIAINIFPLLDGTKTDQDDFIEEVVNEEYPKLPQEIKDYLETLAENSHMGPGFADSPQGVFTRSIIFKLGDLKKQNPPPEKKSFWQKLFRK